MWWLAASIIDLNNIDHWRLLKDEGRKGCLNSHEILIMFGKYVHFDPLTSAVQTNGTLMNSVLSKKQERKTTNWRQWRHRSRQWRRRSRRCCCCMISIKTLVKRKCLKKNSFRLKLKVWKKLMVVKWSKPHPCPRPCPTPSRKSSPIYHCWTLEACSIKILSCTNKSVTNNGIVDDWSFSSHRTILDNLQIRWVHYSIEALPQIPEIVRFIVQATGRLSDK